MPTTLPGDLIGWKAIIFEQICRIFGKQGKIATLELTYECQNCKVSSTQWRNWELKFEEPPKTLEVVKIRVQTFLVEETTTVIIKSIQLDFDITVKFGANAKAQNQIRCNYTLENGWMFQ